MAENTSPWWFDRRPDFELTPPSPRNASKQTARKTHSGKAKATPRLLKATIAQQVTAPTRPRGLPQSGDTSDSGKQD